MVCKIFNNLFGMSIWSIRLEAWPIRMFTQIIKMDTQPIKMDAWPVWIKSQPIRMNTWPIRINEVYTTKYLSSIYHWTFHCGFSSQLTGKQTEGRNHMIDHLVFSKWLCWAGFIVSLMDICLSGHYSSCDYSEKISGWKSTVCLSLMKVIIELSHWNITKQIACFWITHRW